jgi:hypothetical protein
LEPFRARLASKFANSANLKERKNLCVNIQNTDFDANLESVENIAKKFTPKSENF